jgi:hypothetical protein
MALYTSKIKIYPLARMSIILTTIMSGVIKLEALSKSEKWFEVKDGVES